MFLLRDVLYKILHDDIIFLTSLVFVDMNPEVRSDVSSSDVVMCAAVLPPSDVIGGLCSNLVTL